MGRTYEYWATKNDEDFSVNLEVVSFSGTKGTFSPSASDPDEYYGSQEIEWKSEENIDWMSERDIQAMEEWLVNEHSEYLAEQDYFD